MCDHPPHSPPSRPVPPPRCRDCALTCLCHTLDSPQRPTAKELLKHKLIVRHAKKTSYLTELVDKYKRWKAEQSRTTESSSDESDS